MAWKGKRKGTKRNGTKVSKKVRKYVRSALKHDKIMKQHYITFADSGISTGSGTGFLLNQTAAAVGSQWEYSLYRGDKFNQREGDQIRIHQVNFAVTVGCSGATPSANTFRVMMFYHKAPNGEPINILDIIASSATGQGVNSPYRNDMIKKFTMIYDKTHSVVSQYNQTAAGGNHVTVKVNKKFKTPLKTVYYPADETNQIDDISIGALYVLMFANTSTLLQFSGQCSLIFSDA